MSSTLLVLAQPRQEATSSGKPSFPPASPLSDSNLASFVGPRSCLLFDLIGGGDRWFLNFPSHWADMEYRRLAGIVNELAVVNDAGSGTPKT